MEHPSLPMSKNKNGVNINLILQQLQTNENICRTDKFNNSNKKDKFTHLKNRKTATGWQG